MTTEDALWAEVEANPSDTTKLILSDCVRESGSVWLAHAIKWCVENRRWPKQRSNYHGGDWTWTSGRTGKIPKKITNVLPASVYKLAQREHSTLIRKYDYTEAAYKFSRSLRGCLTRLAMAIERAGTEWGLQPPH